MGKKLNLKNLIELSKEQNQVGELKLNIGKQEFTVKYDKTFKTTKIQNLIKEWLEIKEEISKADIELNMYDISFTLILKYFTDVPFESFENILEQAEHYIRITNLLVDLKDNEGKSLFENIFMVLDNKQILKITESMNKAGEIILDEVKKLQESDEYKKALKMIEEDKDNE